MLVTSNKAECLRHFIHNLQQQFTIKDLGILHYFLGIQVRRTLEGFFLNQEQYFTDLLAKYDMQHSSACPTPLAVGTDLYNPKSEPMSDLRLYQRALGALQYLTNTRPDICFAVNKLSQFLHSLCSIHWQAVKHLF